MASTQPHCLGQFEPEPSLLRLLVLWFHLCSVLSPLSFFPPLPLWLSWVPCSEATPTAGTVPTAEVTGVAWGSTGGGQPGGADRGRGLG